MMLRQTFFIFVFSICIAASAFAQPVAAHSSGGSFIATTSPYVIDIGYDPAAFIEGEYSRFDFVLQNEAGKQAPYSYVWVRIRKGTETLLATGLYKQQFGPTTLLYTFAWEGVYELDASFRDTDGDEIARAQFSITVLPSSDESAFPEFARYLLSFVSGLLVGIVLVFLFSKFKNVRRS
jgi:hypothetical protein